MARSHLILLALSTLALSTIHLVAAHGDDQQEESGTGGMGMKMDMNMSTSDEHNITIPVWEGWQPSYFRHGAYSGWITIHIFAMIVSWILIMPVAIMLSVARSKLSLVAQIVFHAVNGVGIFAGFVYNQSTPDLYVTNAHHALGWVVQSLTIVWTLLSICTALNDWQKQRANTHAFSSTSAGRPLLSPQTSDRHEHFRSYADRPSLLRFSQDSGNFTESRTNSYDEAQKEEHQPLSPGTVDVQLDETDHDQAVPQDNGAFSGHTKLDRMLSGYATRIGHSSISTGIRFTQIVLEKFLLLLGFTALVTGFVTYGGIFRGNEVFSGAAHYVKGAIFFWYGLLTLGRWMGAFAEFGWAWNLRPGHSSIARWKRIVPSAEFTESFVIWLYGASNVFLEHLGAEDSNWAPQDFEHVSITVLFFGGGLLGMLIEQQWLRKLMSTSVEAQKSDAAMQMSIVEDEDKLEQQEKETQLATEKISLNPMPALTIMLLGSMMSAHHQKSMVSTMMHKQWGTLFSGFAMARLVTYVIMYLKPPTTNFPSRPPSELVAAFCLISGGFLFMNSARDSVRSIETNGLDAMTIFTISMGLTGLVMAWEMVCFAIKGWAQRKQRLAAGKPLP